MQIALIKINKVGCLNTTIIISYNIKQQHGRSRTQTYLHPSNFLPDLSLQLRILPIIFFLSLLRGTLDFNTEDISSTKKEQPSTSAPAIVTKHST